MANQEHLDILGQGVEVWNRWRDDNKGIRPNLRGAGLFNADLCGVDLHNANLRLTSLGDSNLQNAYLRYANLSLTNLDGANLRLTGLYDRRDDAVALDEVEQIVF